MLDPGRLRERVTLRRGSETQNSRGGYTTSWGDVATVSAEVIGLDGHESMMDQVLQGISTYRVTIRWRADVLASDQLRSAGNCFGDRDVNIRSIVDPDGKRQWLTLIADTASARSN